MARYDRLRADGFGPAEAMRETAPLFARPPHARDAHYTPRPALEPGTGQDVIPTAVVATAPGTDESPELPGALERRGMQILGALQARAQAQHRPPLGEAEQRTVLETITNLPADVIDRVVHSVATTGASRGSGPQPVTGSVTPGTSPASTSPGTRPWEHDFPFGIQTVVATATETAPQRPPTTGQARGQQRSPDNRPHSRPAPRHRRTR